MICVRAAPARCRRARARPRRTPGDRGSPESGPSAPTRRRRTSSRCTARARRAARRRATRRPRNARRGDRVGRPSRSSAGWRAPSSYVSSGCSRRVACCSRSSACIAAVRRVERRRAARRSSRLDTTSTARDASSTCTIGPLYSGAIFTAVCCRLVVAPPISSGSVKPRRSISCATNTISSSDGVIRPLRPMMSAFCSIAASQDLRRRHHHAEVDDLVVVAAEHDADDVLADVVDVAFDRGHQHACPAR